MAAERANTGPAGTKKIINDHATLIDNTLTRVQQIELREKNYAPTRFLGTVNGACAYYILPARLDEVP